MATTFQVWGKPPPSVWDTLTPRQRRSLDVYINLRIAGPCYRIAYDCGYADGLNSQNKTLKRPKRHPSTPNREDAGT